MSDILKAIGAVLLILLIFWLTPGCVSITLELDRKENKSIYENYVLEETDTITQHEI